MADGELGRGAERRTRRAPATRNPAMAALRQRRRVLVRVLIAGMVLVALLFVFVFPARTLLAQREQTEDQRKTLELLQRQSSKLEEESRRLQNDAEVERMAREQYGFVYPGERPFVVVPPSASAPPSSTTTTKPAKRR